MTAASTARAKERWTLTAIRAWAVIGILLLLAAAGWLLSAVSAALVPFGIGLLIVLLLRRPVEILSKKMPRIVAVLVCYMAALLAIALALTFIIPPIFSQISQFVQAVPGYVQQAFKLWDTTIVHPAKGAGVPAWLQASVIALKDQMVAGAGSWSSAIAQGALSAGRLVATIIFSIVIAFVVGFYALLDVPDLEREIFLIAGEGSRKELAHALRTISRVLGGWLRGTLIESTSVAVLYTIGLTIVGQPYALAIGVIGGVLNIIPYVGPFIVIAIAVAAGLFISPAAALWSLVAVVAVQQLDALVMQPRIMSAQVGLHPLIVIFALLAGATLFGVPGMVLSVPVAAVVKGLFVYWFEKRSELQIGSEDGVLFRTSKAEDEMAAADLVEEDVEAAVAPDVEPEPEPKPAPKPAAHPKPKPASKGHGAD